MRAVVIPPVLAAEADDAVEDALAYGEIGPARRSLLDRLRQSLEVSLDDARRIEADLGV